MKSSLSLLSSYRGALMGVAIIWVMLYHLGDIDVSVISVIFGVGYGGVDIFLFLSGFGLYFSLSKKETSLPRYYKKRFCRVLPEFWLYLLILFFIQMDFDFRSVCTLLFDATTIGYWIPGNPDKLWYVSCLVVFYAIFPFYFRLFKKHGLKVSMYFIVGGLLLTIAYALVMVFCFNNENKGELLILSISRIPIFFIGAVVGYYVKERKESAITHKVKVVNWALFAVSLVVLYYFRKYHYEYCWTCALLFVPFIFITPTLCVILAWLFDKLPHVISSIFTKIGLISLELYIAHDIIYLEFLNKFFDSYGMSVGTLMVFALSFLAAIILYYINKHVLQPVCRRMLKL